jgi:hypothetical protein
LNTQITILKPLIIKLRYVLIILMISVFLLLISFCSPIITFLEPSPPLRSFDLNDLLISQEVVSSTWLSFTPFYPSGDDLVTKESTAIRFGVIDGGVKKYLAEQAVYRYVTIGTAQRVFDDRVKPRNTRALYPIQEWNYQSTIAEQTTFGCDHKALADVTYCEWVGKYEEFIIVFSTKMITSEMSLTDMERIVKAIDGKMSFYLKMVTPTLPKN